MRKNYLTAIYLGSEADVMITILCSFRQFSAKKIAFFLKTNVIIQMLQKLTVCTLNKKRQLFFAKIYKKS
jgi:hypothetical protein